jgi:hypothetical protein
MLYFVSPIPQLSSASLLIEDAASGTSLELYQHEMPRGRGANHEISPKGTLKIELVLIAVWSSLAGAVSRNTVRKILRSGETSLSYEREVHPSAAGRQHVEQDRAPPVRLHHPELAR